jgi:hypothetical protein
MTNFAFTLLQKQHSGLTSGQTFGTFLSRAMCALLPSFFSQTAIRHIYTTTPFYFSHSSSYIDREGDKNELTKCESGFNFLRLYESLVLTSHHHTLNIISFNTFLSVKIEKDFI